MRSWGKYEPRSSSWPGEKLETSRKISGAPGDHRSWVQRCTLPGLGYPILEPGDPPGESPGSPMEKPRPQAPGRSPAGPPIPSLEPCRLRKQKRPPASIAIGTISCGAPRAIRDRGPQDIDTTPGQGKPPCRASAQPPGYTIPAPPIQGSTRDLVSLMAPASSEAQKKYEGQIKGCWRNRC